MTDPVTAAYTTAFTNCGGFISSTISAERHPNAGGGFGVMAKQRIRAGAVVAHVPQNLFVTARTARAFEHLEEFTALPPIVCIAVHLARERLRAIERKWSLMKQRAGGRDDWWSALLPREHGGFSLAHVDVDVSLEDFSAGDSDWSRRLLKNWVAHLPSQYDNLVQFAPHLDALSNRSQQDLVAQPQQRHDEDEQSQQQSPSWVQEWFRGSRNFERAVQNRNTPSSPNEETNDQQQQQQQDDVLVEMFLALNLPLPYATKSATEVASWRNVACRHINLLSFSSWKSHEQNHFGNTEENEEATGNDDGRDFTLPPTVSLVINKHRRRVHAPIAEFFSNQQILVELFSWAYSSLMSRGFSWDDEIWLMQPWVDYFNYAPADDYNVSISYNPSQRRYEFRTKEVVKPDQELNLHYGTYADFELALWYGFTLCQLPKVTTDDDETTSAKENANDDDADDDAKQEDCEIDLERDGYNPNKLRRLPSPTTSTAAAAASTKDDESSSSCNKHQSECEYIFSPLADPNGNHSVPEFKLFVARIAMIAMKPFLSDEVARNANDNRRESSRHFLENHIIVGFDRQTVNECSTTVSRSVLSENDDQVPRCTISRRLNLCANSNLESLCDSVGQWLTQNWRRGSSNSENKRNAMQNVKTLSGRDILHRLVEFELAHAFGCDANNSAATELVEMTRINKTSAAGFARQIGRDSKNILVGALEELLTSQE